MWCGLHFVGVEAERRPAVNRAAFDRSDEHPGEAGVQTEFSGAGDFQFCVGAPRGFSDENKFRRNLQSRIRVRLKGGSGIEKLFVSELALSRRVDDKAIFGVALGTCHVPSYRRGAEEQLTSGSASFAETVVGSANAAACPTRGNRHRRVDQGA